MRNAPRAVVVPLCWGATAALWACAAGPTLPEGPPSPWSLSVSPDTATVWRGARETLTATVKDSAGNRLSGYEVQWSSANPGVATVDSAGIVTGFAVGRTAIRARLGALSDSATLDVHLPPIETLALAIDSRVVEVGDTTMIRATAIDVLGDTANERIVITLAGGRGEEPDLAVVDAGRRLISRGPGRIVVLAEADTVRKRDSLDIVAEYRLVAAGGANTCGVTVRNLTLCWGWAHVSGRPTHRFGPVTLTFDLQFAIISIGGSLDYSALHACGITVDGNAYCWGSNDAGQLGNGSWTYSDQPVPVAGGLTFRAVAAGVRHTCGVAEDSTAYCWGANWGHALGWPSDRLFEAPMPVPTGAGLKFKNIAAGLQTTCALGIDDVVYCWGTGPLGNDSVSQSPEPRAVASSEDWAIAEVNQVHGCSLTVDQAAYCWGQGEYGRLGVGDENVRFVPTAIAGGSAFRALGIGVRHSCALAIGGRVYCWGANDQGQLGDGTRTTDVVAAALVPQEVRGPLQFVSLSVGDHHACGIATDKRLYCWGGNPGGALGRGTVGDPTPSLMPSPVFGQR